MEWMLIVERFPQAYVMIGIRYLISAGIAFFLFYIVFRKQKRFKKIQERFPKLSDYQRDIFFSALTVAIFAVVALLSFRVLRPYNILFDSLNDQPVWYWLLTIIPVFFIHDFYFYWMHRLMHQPKLFRYIHNVHHQSTNPSPWTAYAFHPLEAILEAFIITILVFTVPTHAAVIVAFMLFQIVYNVYGHLGFELFPGGFHKTAIGRHINTSVAHNLHHHKFNGNYGLYTLLWDRLFGTLREDYGSSFEAATGRQKRKDVVSEA